MTESEKLRPIEQATQLILASSSPYRRELLGRLQVDFLAHAADIDESALLGESPRQLVARLARQKAAAVRAQTNRSNSLFIGSDQVAVIEGKIVGKPGNFTRAQRQLQASSGKRLQFLTSLCVLSASDDQAVQETVVTATVTFRKLSNDVIDRYLETEQPFDCAGSFKCEGLGISLMESLESHDPTALIGLPLIALTSFLLERGVQIPG